MAKIIEEANLRIVCRLGGFQMMMSSLGNIRNLMKGLSHSLTLTLSHNSQITKNNDIIWFKIPIFFLIQIALLLVVAL